ncbi:hypothetical protein ACLOJK_022013 [Asimina triloba]
MSITVLHYRMLTMVLVVATLSSSSSVLVCDAALTVGFYNETCPSAEDIIQQAVADAFANNSGIAAGLIRMHFHDCFVRGCDGSVLLDSTPGNQAEKDSPINFPSLRGFEVIAAAKAAIESACANTVSCADILAFAARDSATLAGNISYQVPAGRRDGLVSNISEVAQNIPSPLFNSTQLIANFAAKNLTADNMVTLSGAHSIGVSHCASFTNRLYDANGTAANVDPTLSSSYAGLLRSVCPANSTSNDTTVVALDIITPTALDNRYYTGVGNNLGLLTSDHALVTETSLAASVSEFAANQSDWAAKFAVAMVKMGLIEVLEGSQGEIRRNCSVVNNATSFTMIKTLRGYGIAKS